MLNSPISATCDGAGGLYIGTQNFQRKLPVLLLPLFHKRHAADSGNGAVRFVSAAGIMTTLAGALIDGFLLGFSTSTTGLTAVSNARIGWIQGVLSDGAGGALCAGEKAVFVGAVT